jgi:hypothetical protein
VTVTDPSEFESGLTVRGEVLHNRYRVLTLESSSISNVLAALLLYARDPPAASRTSTSSGPRAAPSPTSCASSSSARTRSPRSPERSCARTGPAERASTPTEQAATSGFHQDSPVRCQEPVSAGRPPPPTRLASTPCNGADP